MNDDEKGDEELGVHVDALCGCSAGDSLSYSPAAPRIRRAVYGLPYGFCPLCNNELHKVIDTLLMCGEVGEVVKMGFLRNEALNHLANHISPLYERALATKLAPSSCGLDPDSSTDRVARLAVALKEKRDGAPPAASVDEALSGGDGEYGYRREWDREYAYRGGKKLGHLHSWSVGRTQIEAEERMSDALNFYDEMVDINEKCKATYNDAMGYGKDGLAARVSALHERRGVITDLAKMGIIAKKLCADGEGDVKELAAPLASLLDSILSPKLAGKTPKAEAVTVASRPGEAAPLPLAAPGPAATETLDVFVQDELDEIDELEYGPDLGDVGREEGENE